MQIARTIQTAIVDHLQRTAPKIVILYGARQTGKTTLAREVLKALNIRTLSINGDQQKYVDVLASRDERKLRNLIGNYQCLFVDEAQRIPDIGLNLKILHDTMPDLRILVTGSSSIHIASGVSEALTGRKRVFSLYPFSLLELKQYHSPFELDDMLDELLIYGSYPEVFKSAGYNEKETALRELGGSYLYKDMFELAEIRNKKKLRDILRLLAFQVGSEVSVNEISRQTGISREAVSRYIALLEQAFVIFRLTGYSRNLRKEVSKKDKYFFYDTGIRNMMINNFNEMAFRNDQGPLWENFVIAERMKYLDYLQKPVNPFFWRTYTGGEIDYLEERNGKLNGYEIKYNKTRAKAPKTWLDTYPGSGFAVVSRHNYPSFLME